MLGALLVLLAVFVPTIVMPGITGRLYRPFAITISVATLFSSLNALTLSPALCGVLLRPTPSKRGWFFTLFNKVFDASTSVYTKITGALVGVQPFGGFNMSGSNSKAGGPDYLRLFMEMKTYSRRL